MIPEWAKEQLAKRIEKKHGNVDYEVIRYIEDPVESVVDYQVANEQGNRRTFLRKKWGEK